jgi:hypothetical protein
VVTLKNPMIVNDSIVAPSAPVPGAPFAVPRRGVMATDVRALEVAQFSPQRTVVLVAAVAAVAVGWARAASAGGGGSRPPGEDVDKGLMLQLFGLRLPWGFHR